MNAAARVINQNNVFSGSFLNAWESLHVSVIACLRSILVLLVLLSALAVVYVTNVHRTSVSQLQMAEQQAHQLELQWGQLLLEQASLAAPARVERLASQKLHMILPVNKQVFILRAR